jgi:hypothetical protein
MMPPETMAGLLEDTTEIGKMLHGLRNALRSGDNAAVPAAQ